MKYATTLILLLIAAGLFYLLGSYISTRLAQKKYKKRKKERSPSKFPLSAFSVLNHPAASVGKEQFTPVREAEVYLAYGKKRDAEEVLELALRQGEITAEEVAAFWAERSAGKAAE